MTRIIGVISAKGGVGKTSVVSNLACALVSEFDQTVTVIDGNISASNLGLSYGLYDTQVTLNHVLRSEAYLTEAMHMHPSGVRVVPASMDLNELGNVDPRYLGYAVDQLFGFSDFVILDSAPGIGMEALGAIVASRELLFVTTPHMPSIVNLTKSNQISKKLRRKVIGVVVNRVKGKKYEYFKDEIEELSKLPVISQIPEDENVLRSANSREPAIMSHPYSPASREFRRLAAYLVGEEYREPNLFDRMRFRITKRYQSSDLKERIEHYEKTAKSRMDSLRKAGAAVPQKIKLKVPA